MQNKVLIEIRDGQIVSVNVTDETEVCIVNWDNIDEGIPAVEKPYFTQSFFNDGMANELFLGHDDNATQSIIDSLKDIKF